MKKIGIITLTGNKNFGNKLQNYALQEYLKKFKIENETIKNYTISNNTESCIKILIKITIRKIKNILKFILKKDERIRIKREKKFKEFNININYCKKTITLKNSKKFNNFYDYFITGSDQVWNPKFYALTEIETLAFANEEKRISYAASFGLSEMPSKYEKNIKKYIKYFKAISVRENTGKEIIEKITGRDDAEVVVDPTMLLEKEDWENIIKKPEKMKNEQKYILVYFLGNMQDEQKQDIQKFAKEYNYEIINILDINSKYYVSGPSEFLWFEKNATLICTDSFHAAVFAIIYNVPFIVFKREVRNNNNMSSRIDNLLSKFKLEERYYNGQITEDCLKCDYSNAMEILKKEKEKSKKFLKNAMDIK